MLIKMALVLWSLHTNRDRDRYQDGDLKVAYHISERVLVKCKHLHTILCKTF